MQEKMIDSMNTAQKTLQDSLAQSKTVENLGFYPGNITFEALLITVLGYVIVFMALVLLYLFIANYAKLLRLKILKNQQSKGEPEAAKFREGEISGEVSAAISLALSLHFAELHDDESKILTIKKTQRAYSPWSSKIYGLRQYPR